ncbi:sterol carrier protein domain-containing protein, partial [Nocardia terpenica]|uniref:sterol carrier protein domain-containing protein n=1 Tax=Nocardia terpenica TaxID=455432 RepID=UPI00189342B9
TSPRADGSDKPRSNHGEVPSIPLPHKRSHAPITGRTIGYTLSCQRTHAPADLRLTSTELGAAYLGGTTLASLAAAGLIEELRTGVVAHASTAFRHDREPHYPGGWAFPLY